LLRPLLVLVLVLLVLGRGHEDKRRDNDTRTQLALSAVSHTGFRLIPDTWWRHRCVWRRSGQLAFKVVLVHGLACLLVLNRFVLPAPYRLVPQNAVSVNEGFAKVYPYTQKKSLSLGGNVGHGRLVYLWNAVGARRTQLDVLLLAVRDAFIPRGEAMVASGRHGA